MVVERTPDEGTKVNVRVPVSAGSTKPGPLELSRPRRGEGEMVLIVDDDAAVLAALAAIVEWLGYRTTVTARAEEAVGVLERERSSIAVVVSDVMMPGMGGEGLARVVAERWPATPVILMSGHPMARPDESGAERAVEVIRIHKPFSSAELAEALGTVVG